MCGITLDGTAQLFQQVQAGLRQNEPQSSNMTGNIIFVTLRLSNKIT